MPVTTEFKTITPSGFKTTGQGSATFIIATTGVVDADGDVLVRGAIGDQVVTVLPAHRWDALPLGKARVSERGEQVVAEVQFNPTPEAQSWYEAIRFDYENPPAVQQYSWGYDATRSSPGKLHGQPVRYLEKVTMFEVSPVVIGASVNSHTAGVKQAGLSLAELAVLRHAQAEVDGYEAEVRSWLKSVAAGLTADLRVARWCADLGELYGGRLEPVGAGAVPVSRRAVAESAARTYAKRLRTGVPRVAWFAEPEGLTVHGGANVSTGTVLVNAFQPPREIWVTTAHEVGHMVGWNEAQCRAFEYFAAKEYTA